KAYSSTVLVLLCLLRNAVHPIVRFHPSFSDSLSSVLPALPRPPPPPPFPYTPLFPSVLTVTETGAGVVIARPRDRQIERMRVSRRVEQIYELHLRLAVVCDLARDLVAISDRQCLHRRDRHPITRVTRHGHVIQPTVSP